MAKKQKRSTSSGLRAVPTAPTAFSPSTATAKPGARSLNVEFNPDYSPVIKDLKRIAILAVTFVGILVVLSFFLR